MKTPSSGSMFQNLPVPAIAIIAAAIVVIILLVLGVSRCTAQPAEDASSDATPSASAASASTASVSAASAATQVTVADPAWKKAAGVAELTSSGTDPTSIAAQMEAERVAANEVDGYFGVEDRWVPGGLFTTGDAELDQMVKSFCDDHTSSDLTQAENANNVFCFITWADYVEWEGNQYPRTYDWAVKYGKDFFERGGNCFSMAAATQWCMRYFGYTDTHAEITYQLRQSETWLDHGLNWLTDPATGEIKMLDTEMAANGWMMDPDTYTVEILDPTSDWEPRSSAYEISQMV